MDRAWQRGQNGRPYPRDHRLQLARGGADPLQPGLGHSRHLARGAPEWGAGARPRCRHDRLRSLPRRGGVHDRRRAGRRRSLHERPQPRVAPDPRAGREDQAPLRHGRAPGARQAGEGVAQRGLFHRRPAISAPVDRADHGGARPGIAGGAAQDAGRRVHPRADAGGNRADGRGGEAVGVGRGRGQDLRRAGAPRRGAGLGDRGTPRSGLQHGPGAALLRPPRPAGAIRRRTARPGRSSGPARS